MSVNALNSTVEIACKRGTIKVGPDAPLTFFLGPCALESREHALFMSNAILEIAEKLAAQVVYKTSFDKANRTSIKGYRGMELDEALDIFAEVKEKTGLPMLTDVHLPEQCEKVAKVVDVLQIPAFLCRQTDMLQAAAETGRVVKVKKGQFLAPWDMKNVVDKLVAMGAKDVLLTERGSSFGYNALVTDMRGLPEMAAMAPVVIDATHSVQQPGGKGGSTGGQREYVPVIAKAAVAVGVSGVFLETHQDPDTAPSDGPNMVILSQLEKLMSELIQINALVKSF
ncbi:3-deoxy-8-phosphooctulonate synthase [Hirschia litorea]|uniref:2-dehydro-3-deoxyphosphooctonate aldolase n=1 Tax=Hirschia litorea TaxID=1199156 RepID=A0ABW2II67_9PROT